MAKLAVLTNDVTIHLNGAEVNQAVMAKLSSLVIEQHTHLPHMFTFRFQDSDLALLDKGPFDLAKEVEVFAKTPDGKKVSLLQGEITALEPEFEEGMIAQLVIRGYDKSHRLYRETKTKAYLNIKDSDLAAEVAKAANLKTEIETTQTVYEHIFQHNQSNLAFLMQRAWRIGYECFVSEGKLYFRKPPTGEAQATLTWGQDLLSFHPRLTLAEQVDEVMVRGWDVEKRAAIVGRANKGQLYPKIEEKKNGASFASTFGQGKLVIVDQPVISQAEADLLAAARMNELSGAFIEAEGVAYRRPDLKAGQMITLKALGQRLSGTFLATSVTHMYTAEGLKTTFTVRGSRNGLLLEQMVQQPPLDQWTGVVPALVTNTNDEKGWGRVKLKFPWMSDNAESDWARVVSPGAGPEAGFCLTPAVDDEVVVAFANGDFNQPFVLGGVWNGKNKIVPEIAKARDKEQKPLVRSWRSRGGHYIAMYDDKQQKLEIVTKGGHRFVLDDANKKIIIESKGDIEIKASGSFKVKAKNEVKIEGKTIDLN